MKYSFVAAALAAPVVLAAPAKRQSTNIDTTVLQFALTLEHLENVFYHEALAKFSQDDFLKAGYGANYYNNLKYIASDELSHVQFLQAALTAAGQTPTDACTYSFPYTDVSSFITLSSIIEGVGTSAYLGGAPLITSKDYLTAAGSILVTEALHTSLQRNAVNEIPFGSPYGTPLDPTSVYTLATAFIKTCPPTNPTLPFTPFPALALNTTAGTCEQPDCNPKIFQKRGWEEAPVAGATATVTVTQPAGATATVTVTKTEGSKATYAAGGKGPEKGGEGEHYDGENKGHEGGDYNGNEGGDYEGHDGYNAGGDKGSHEGSDVGGYNGGHDGSDMEGYNGSHGGDYEGENKPAPATKNQPALKAGQTATFTAAGTIPAGSFLTFVSGLTVVSVPANIDGSSASAAIPTAAMGQTYVFVTSAAAAGNKLDGTTVLFGPAILEVTPGAPVY